MHCPFFQITSKIGGSIGICGALKSTYIPRIEHMGSLCFSDDFAICPIFESCSALAGEVKKELFDDNADSSQFPVHKHLLNAEALPQSPR